MKLSYAQIVDMCSQAFQAASANFGTKSDSLNWSTLVEAMLVLQQVRQIHTQQREAFEEYMAAVPLRDGGEAIVKRVTGRSIAEVLKDRA